MQIIVAKIFGVQRLIVCVNKMDLCSYNQGRFNHIVATMRGWMRKQNMFKKAKFIPVSGLQGDNLNDVSARMIWNNRYLIQELEAIKLSPTSCRAWLHGLNKPLRMAVQDATSVRGVGTVVMGYVYAGLLEPGMRLRFVRSGLTATCCSIQIGNKQVGCAVAGDSIGMKVQWRSSIDRSDNACNRRLVRGDVASNDQEPPARPVRRFLAQIRVLDHNRIQAGFTPIMRAHVGQCPCRINTLLSCTETNTEKVVSRLPPVIKTGDVAMVVITPRRLRHKPSGKWNQAPPPLEVRDRFCLCDNGRVVAIGIVKHTQCEGEGPEPSGADRRLHHKKDILSNMFSSKDDQQWCLHI